MRYISRNINTVKINPTTTINNPDWVENFDIADYSVSGSNSPNSYSQSTDAPKGEQSLYMDAKTTRSEIYKTLSTPQNLSNKIFRIWVKCSDWNNIGTDGFNIGFRDTTGTLSYFRFTDLSTYEKHNNEWTPITFSTRQLRGTLPVMSNINRIYFRGMANSGNLEIQVAYLEAISQPSEGIISIMFDDGKETVMEGAKIMAKYGLSGSNGVIRQYVGGSGYLTLDEMRELEGNYGWEHVVHGSAVYNKTDDEIARELKDAKQWMLDNGFARGSSVYVSPNGYVNEAMKSTLQKYYSACRTVSRISQAEGFYNPYNIGAVSVQHTESPSSINSIIDDAMNNKEWLIIVFHNIVSSSPGSSEYLDTDFDTIMQHIFNSGYKVKKFSTVI